MDKYEYKVRADEIKELISRGEYVQAAEIADTIDWRRVKSIMMLCTISDLYKINRRYEDARDMLLLAYERRPGGRTICYSLCELSIKMEEFVEAVEYYKEFVQVAPKDSGRYILQYKLYEAQDVSLEERIAVLEELKKRDYREKWAYELAYLYHRVGLAARCVEECDELILWFGEGKYVIKAMELKMLHEPLTTEQQAKYDRRFAPSAEELAPEFVDREREAGKAAETDKVSGENRSVAENTPVGMDTIVYTPAGHVQEEDPDELDIHVKTVDVSEYNTVNLQAEIAAGLREILAQDKPVVEDPVTRSILAPLLDSDTESLDYPEIDEVSEDDLETDEEVVEESEVFFGETGEIADVTAEIVMEQLRQEVVQQENVAPMAEVAEKVSGAEEPEVAAGHRIVLQAEPPKALAKVLSQEPDGQLSLVMPESESIEKQITGQISIDDILAEWERIKKENQEKRQEEVRQHVLEHTGNLFTDFELAVRDGLLEQLEQDRADAGVINAEAVPMEEVPAVEEAVEEAVFEETSADGEDADMEEPSMEERPEVAEDGEAEAVIAEDDGITDEDVVEELEEIQEFSEDAIDSEEEYTEEPEEEVIESEMPETRSAVRTLTREEKILYAPYIQTKTAKSQLINAIDNISMAAYTGNVIITGEKGMDTLALAKNMMRELQAADSNFSGKVAKISGVSLNDKDVAETVGKLKNGALIISEASGMSADTAAQLHKSLQQESFGIVVIMEDCKKSMDRFLAEQEELHANFTARVDVTALSNDTLVAYGRQYAREREYSIDEFGVLALHTRIEELQTLEHAVTVVDVKEIVDEAINHANRKNMKHFFDVLLGRRYDEEDMIILGEKDFV